MCLPASIHAEDTEKARREAIMSDTLPFEITRLSPEEAAAALPQLTDLLCDAIESGASVGFVLPIDPAEIETYWRKILATLSERVLLAAWDAEGQLIGTAQLALEGKSNAVHRAEVQKVLVHRRARGRGIGKALMERIEGEARALNRTLLVLDTRQGDPSEHLYTRLGYQISGMVPQYAMNPERTALDPCTFMYKLLDV
jgi:GNAT superfamily N-acetyltransferase